MTRDITVGEGEAGTTASSRPIVRQARRVILIAAALGILGQLLFFEVALGINFPIAIAMLVGGGWVVRRTPRVPLVDAWLGAAAIGFAAFAAVRSDPKLVALDVLTSLALTGGALASFGGRPVVARSFGGLLGLAVGAMGWAATGAIRVLAGVQASAPTRRTAVSAMTPLFPVLRGIAIAVPILVVFIVLFASADAVFAELVDNVFAVDLELGDIGWRIALSVFIAWLAAGGLAFAAANADPESARATATRMFGTTELVTMLTAINLLFAVFVGLQAAYLFGGLDTLAATGLTYAEYARRGFFELVTVAILAGGLIVFAEQFARSRSRWLLAAAIGLALQSGVVLVSGALRLRLYQEAYGWTELRLYVLATIVVIGACLAALVVAVAWNRVRWVGHVLIVTSLVVGFALNLIGPVRFITEQNVARVLEPELVPDHGSSGLDLAYATGLGDDAVPALLRAIPALDPPDAEILAANLSARLDLLGDEGYRGWQAWNFGRSSARDSLDAARSSGTIP